MPADATNVSWLFVPPSVSSPLAINVSVPTLAPVYTASTVSKLLPMVLNCQAPGARRGPTIPDRFAAWIAGVIRFADFLGGGGVVARGRAGVAREGLSVGEVVVRGRGQNSERRGARRGSAGRRDRQRAGGRTRRDGRADPGGGVDGETRRHSVEPDRGRAGEIGAIDRHVARRRSAGRRKTR